MSITKITKSKRNLGFTLLELLIAAMLTIIISSAALTFLARSNQQYLSQEEISEMQQSLRASIQEVVKQLRMAGFGLADTVPPIVIDSVAGESDTLTVYRDTFAIKFYLDTTTDSLHPSLIKEINAVPSTYATDISQFEASWIPPKSIRITISAKTSKADYDIGGGNALVRTESQVVSLRNVQ